MGLSMLYLVLGLHGGFVMSIFGRFRLNTLDGSKPHRQEDTNMALSSPGIEVTIIDESQYAPPAPASVPFILLATAQNKANGSGTGVATGTLQSNANKLYRISSQRDLTALFGNPFFYKTTNGTPIQGYELNEYGLMAAYSVLGLTNTVYVLRADIDLASLVGRTTRPSGEPADGTYWLNTLTSTWGIYEFNKSSGNFTLKSPLVVTESTDMADTVSGQPKSSVGNIGDYAIVLATNSNNMSNAKQPNTYNTYWFKANSNSWVQLGDLSWRNNWATVQGSNVVTTLTAADTLSINGVSVAVPAAPNNTLAGLVGAINGANISAVTAAVVDSKLELYSSVVGNIVIAAGSGTVLTNLGITAGTYAAPEVFFGTNAQQPRWRSTDPSPHPTGSVWVKTNAANAGCSVALSRYSAASATFISQTVGTSTSDWDINATLDPSGGKNIPAGTVYAQYGVVAPGIATPLSLFRRYSAGSSVFVGTNTNPSISASTSFKVRVSVPGSSSLSSEYTVTLPSSPSTHGASAFVSAWTAANIPHTVAAVASTGAIILTHTEGGVIILNDNGASPSAVSQAGFSIGTTPGAKWGPAKTLTTTSVSATGGTGSSAIFTVVSNGYVPTFTVTTPGTGYVVGDVLTVGSYTVRVNTVDGSGGVTVVAWLSGLAIPQYSVQLSNWELFMFVPSTTAPVSNPSENTPWFYSTVNQVDIMTNVGGEWKGYRNVCYASNGLPQATGTPATDPAGPIIAASAPTTQSDGTALVYGDLWIDSSDLENYPVISRWQNVSGTDSWVAINNSDSQTENGILFADARWAPNGNTDPVNDSIPTIATLLTSNYLDLDAPSASVYPTGTLLFNTRRSGYNIKQFRNNYFTASAFPGESLPSVAATWVTVSGNMSNGAPYMGRKAQRAMVVQALKASISTNNAIREDDTFFNLIATPNYPELQPDMIALNNERANTCYIIGDTPLRLPDDATAIQNWATNAAGAASTGEQGLVTRNSYMGIYYPSGITTDLTGTEIVVPASHMMLRTMIYNDNVAYPWFAPAGQRRGIIDNATNLCYIDATTGEYVVTKNRVGMRNVEYENFINPMAFFTNVGLLNYGNKNSFNSQSSLDRTNVARLVAYLRYQLQQALRPFIFEPNDTVTRNEAKGVVQTLLADIMSKRGIYDYVVVCDETNNTPARIDRNELWIDIAIEPTKAVEFIYVPVRLLNTGEISG